MPQHTRGWIFSWCLISLLAVLPLVRGGQQPWAALMVTAGVLGLLTIAILHAVLRGNSRLIVWTRGDLVLLLGLLWIWIGCSLPSAPPDALSRFLILLGCVGLFFIARALASAARGLWLATRLCAIGGLVALVGLLQLFGVLNHGWWDPPQFVASTFVNHNHFAAYLELLLPLGGALWLAAPLKPAQRFLVAVCCALMAIGLLVSASRGAWFSLVIASAIGLGWLWVRGRRVVWSWRGLLIAVLAVAAIGFLASQPPILTRGMSLLDVPSDQSFQTRQAIWQGTWGVVREHPLIGHGLGSFMFEFTRHRPAGLYGLIIHAFNEYLQGVAELGLVGLAIGGWIAVLVLRRIMRLIRGSHTPWKRALGLGGLIGLGSVAVHSLLDYPWHIPAVAFTFAAVAGLLTGVGYHADPAPLRTLNFSGLPSHKFLVRWVAIPVVIAGCVGLARPLAQRIVADLWAHRARVQYEAGSLHEATDSYQHATRSAPKQSEYHRRLGESLTQLAWQHNGHARRAAMQEATGAYRQALALVPHDASSAHALNETLQALGELAEANRWLGIALTFDPHNPLYWKHWAELKLVEGNATQAAEAFGRAARLTKPYDFHPAVFGSLDDPNYFTQLGESALLLGRLTYAKTAFTIATHMDPRHPGAQVGLALCALRQGEAQAARQMMTSIHAPIPRAQWFAGLAQHHFTLGQEAQAEAALETSLKLDPSNVLARHLELLLARNHDDDLRFVEAVDRLLSLNRPPVVVRSGEAYEPFVVWEPERGIYGQGKKTQSGWALYRDGAIHQPLVVPPGKIRLSVTASGTRAKGRGPMMAVFWSGRLLQATVVASEQWVTYEIETDVRPGESLLTVRFANDLNDQVAREDRNLKLKQVVARWERL